MRALSLMVVLMMTPALAGVFTQTEAKLKSTGQKLEKKLNAQIDKAETKLNVVQKKVEKKAKQIETTIKNGATTATK